MKRTKVEAKMRPQDLELHLLRQENAALKKKIAQQDDYIKSQSADFYLKILESIPSDLVVFNAKHQYLYMNPVAISGEEMRQWIIGKDDFDYCKKREQPIDLAITRRAHFNKVKTTKKELIFEEKMVKKDGTEVWNLRRMYPVLDDKKEVTYVVGYATDISHLKKIESDLNVAKQKARKSMKIKEEFLANMSHEIRTPMNAILGMSDLLKKSGLKGKNLEYLKGINKGAKNLLVLINDILDFSKISSKKLELENIPVNLEQELHQVNTLFQFKCIEKDVFLQFTVDPRISGIGLKTDPLRLNQILNNLLSNSIKFTEKGSIGVHVNLMNETPETVTLSFAVNDTGIGISEEKLDFIFTPFSQADSSVTRKYGGTGLGLAITKRIVKIMGGNLEVESEEGKGSTFSFSLTMDKCELALDIDKEQEDVELELPQAYKILLVEDNLMNQLYAQAILENYTENITVANNGQEAIDYMNESQYDLVLMDIQMPVMGGIECTKVIREELKSKVPIIALTANAFKTDKEAYLGAGMDGYLSKPFEEHELRSCLRAVI